MRSSVPRVNGAKKAVWGRAVLFAVLSALLLSVAPAYAQAGKAPKGHAATAAARQAQHEARKARRHSKLDLNLNDAVEDNMSGNSDVIVEFYDDSDSSKRIKAAGGTSGKRLGIINARAGKMPNVLLKRLADDPKVKRIHLDRETDGFISRTAITIGARNVQTQYGYDGAGIGVAVIDSGMSSWHDDLTQAADPTKHRVTAFVDFVAGTTAEKDPKFRYDDWGHGTHVAGIIAGNGYDSSNGNGSAAARQGIASGANIVSLKVLDATGKGRISYTIAALDWVVNNGGSYNIRVINMSLGAGVFESYDTDPLTQAAKRAVDAGIVVVAAAGNMGKGANGQTQYGAIAAPGNAPWVLTVGASSTMGTTDRRDDTMAPYSSRGPTMIDFGAKPDLVAPGSGTVSLSDRNSLFYTTKAQYLVAGARRDLTYLPYLALSGTSMAAPVVSGTVALMLQANPNLTPNMVKAILQFTAQVYNGYDYLSQGAGFLNTLGAVRLSRYFATGQKGDKYPDMKAWSKHIFWGNRRVSGGVLTPGGTAWDPKQKVVWGAALTASGQNIVWGENCDTAACDNIVWGQNIVWGEATRADENIVWGNTDVDNIVWGNGDMGNIVWGNGDMDNIVWGNAVEDNIVWGNDCAGADCDNVAWGQITDDNIVWGNAEGVDNIVWGNSAADNVVWGVSSDGDNVSWGSSAGDGEWFGDDTAEVESFDPSVWEDLFDVPLFGATTPETTTTAVSTVIAPLTSSYVLGGGIQ